MSSQSIWFDGNSGFTEVNVCYGNHREEQEIQATALVEEKLGNDGNDD
jgi:hypothetical protein